ncbi:MAG: dipeptidase [Janthinobacterium lividum]
MRPGSGNGLLLEWKSIRSGAASASQGQVVRLRGWLAAPDLAGRQVLTMEPPCCPGCSPGSNGAVLVEGAALPFGRIAELEGQLDRSGATWVLRSARRVDAGFGRRRLLAASPLLCLAAAAPETNPTMVLADAVTVDVHSHAGGLLRVRTNGPFTPVAEPMREGGLAAVCLAIVSDSPTHHLATDHRIHPFREPTSGELYDYSQRAFARLHAMVVDQGMPLITDAAGMRAARAARPTAIVAAEGADFLEGRLERIDEAYSRWKLRHLQLTHYRVNELGDIQTEEPVHGGLTDFGAAAIGRCNALGIVVDVAHGTLDLARRAAAVTSKPLVLSHTSLTTRPRPFTRLITPEHAKLVAGTGGVIGIWPVKSIFPDMDALAAGIARMAAVVGIDHVALGTDTMGLVGPATFGSYAELPGLARALLAIGLDQDDVRKVLGGNYARVFAVTMAV